jgi:hypothetical protein
MFEELISRRLAPSTGRRFSESPAGTGLTTELDTGVSILSQPSRLSAAGSKLDRKSVV